MFLTKHLDKKYLWLLLLISFNSALVFYVFREELDLAQIIGRSLFLNFVIFTLLGLFFGVLIALKPNKGLSFKEKLSISIKRALWVIHILASIPFISQIIMSYSEEQGGMPFLLVETLRLTIYLLFMIFIYRLASGKVKVRPGKEEEYQKFLSKRRWSLYGFMIFLTLLFAVQFLIDFSEHMSGAGLIN